MTCDEAFDVLTSPAAQCNTALHGHLAVCPRCRDLQEALAPALSAVSSSLSDHADCSRISSETEALARSAAEALSLRSRTVQLPSQRRLFWGWLAGLGCILTVAVVSLLLVPQRGTTPAAAGIPVLDQACLWASRDLSMLPDNARSGDVVLTCVACHTRPGERLQSVVLQ
jgi:hypothetical protein